MSCGSWRAVSWVWPGCALVTVLAACGEAAPAAPPSQVRDSAGVRLVEAPAARLQMPAPLAVDGAAHLRVGTVDGPETTTLSSPTAAARLDDGRLFLVESGSQPARLLDAEGEFLRWIGQVGEGPGEFTYAASGGVLAGDTLWIQDSRRRRIVLYDPEGGFQRAFGYGEPGGATRMRSVRFLRDGTLVHAASTLGGEAVMESGGVFEERLLVHAMDGRGEDARLVVDLPGSTYEVASTETASGQMAVMIRMVDPLFAPLTRVAVDGEGRVWVGDGGDFEIRRLTLTGEVVEAFRGELEPEQVTPARFEAYVQASLADTPEEGRPGREAFLRDREYAETLPAFERLLTDDEGRLWISEYGLHRPGEPPRVWWVVEPGGDVLGRVELPVGFRLLRVEEDELLGVERDEFDVPYLVGYRLRRAE